MIFNSLPRSVSIALLSAAALSPVFAQDSGTPSATPAAPKPAPARLAPDVLPGKGLAQHDFFYAGEAKTRDMFIVKKGKIAWAYHDTEGRGEISDAVLLSNGNILFAHQYGVTLITQEKKVLWHRDAAPKCEIHTAQPIGTDRVIFIQNGPEPKVFVVNVISGMTENEFALPVGNKNSTHGQFRRARLTPQGTILVAHMDMAKVGEYDVKGQEVWSAQFPRPWSVERLASGNTLICGGKLVREVDATGKTVWELTPADLPGYVVSNLQVATRLPNGNTLFNNWFNQWGDKFDQANPPIQVLEVSPDKKIVWALSSWNEPAALGPSTVVQLLDEPGVPEDTRFGGVTAPVATPGSK